MTIDIEQRSPEWHEARLGRVTASRVADIVAKTKSGASASRATYMGQLIAERLSGTATQSFQSAAMANGTECEPEARLAYEFRTDNPVTEVGFVPHPTIEMAGASPDGLVGDDGLVELKCPNTSTHIDTLTSKKIPSKYQTQMLWQMACTGRAWCDFVSFDPRMPEAMQVFIQRFERDDERIAELEKAVTEFLAELDAKIAELRRTYDTERTAA